MRIEKYLDALRDSLDVTTDRDLTILLGVSHSVVSHWRTGRMFMSNETCMHIAELLSMDSPLQIIVAVDMDRAEKAGVHSLWERFLPQMARAT